MAWPAYRKTPPTTIGSCIAFVAAGLEVAEAATIIGSDVRSVRSWFDGFRTACWTEPSDWSRFVRRYVAPLLLALTSRRREPTDGELEAVGFFLWVACHSDMPIAERLITVPLDPILLARDDYDFSQAEERQRFHRRIRKVFVPQGKALFKVTAKGRIQPANRPKRTSRRKAKPKTPPSPPASSRGRRSGGRKSSQ